MRILIILIALGLMIGGGAMLWKIARSLRLKKFTQGAIARRRDQPFWYWTQIVAWTVMAIFLIWGGLSLLAPDVIPLPPLPCSPKVPGDCGR